MRKKWLHERALEFAAAIAYFTRIRLPKNLSIDESHFSRCLYLWPFTGWLLWSISFLIIYLLQLFLSIKLSILIGMLILIWSSGAIHEDGLADSADAFLGSYGNRARILEIMKDPRLGSFGVVSLIFSLLIKYEALKIIFQEDLLLVYLAIIWSGYSSRAFGVFLAWRLNYAGSGEKTPKHFPEGNWPGYLIIFAPTALTLIYYPISIFIVVCYTISYFIYTRFLKNTLNGYNGDSLGAFQQILEIIGLIAWTTLI